MDFGEHERAKSQLSIAPLIDVVFLLLVFFMLAGSFIRQTAFDLAMGQRPLPGEATAVETGPLLVRVADNGRITLNGLVLPLDQLGGELLGRSDGDAEHKVTLRAGGGVAVQRLVSVMDRITGAGFHNIRLTPPDS
ncbi:MAG: biopolymer transporter ExbD [Alphaproteobacteria bacterium]|jgi:biopolymer transport protein ExbD|nr:biopolymer transporter ExbD [Alphaproteobacteria bacterium]MDP6237231.1 biopolymer transporter ExbD [Alphaproteobacteria bacterium]MDP7174087.1 biopolymer transporter ExbD [Alphaproteobacteria bacterium]MDP7488121.1 biopolymer transporter ExbD [Alphaproteobacteria bacterium]MEE1543245.1 biopolymer transporter ExbD [Alphaproteobacteria bacterium]|tara:strand:+ start:3498 stop:3905 length:408 start_codon:yes stop_codon:yes gene_type:complete